MNKVCMSMKLLWMFVVSFFAASVSAGGTVYVRSGATGDGSSWTSAFGSIQQAVDSAAKRNADVWVATGVYEPDSSDAICLKPGVSLYGGFAGNESLLSERDIKQNPTVINGGSKKRCLVQDINFEDSSAVVIDGFTFQYGLNKYFENGCVTLTKKNTTFNHCVFENTSSGSSAVYAEYSVIKNCRFADNAAVALNIYGGFVDSCEFSGNTGFSGYPAIIVKESKISNSLIHDNYTEWGVISVEGSVVSNCRICNNGSERSSTINLNNGRLEGSLVYENTSNYKNSIIYSRNTSFLINSTVANNTTRSESTIGYYDSGSGYLKIANSIIYGNKMTADANSQVAAIDNIIVMNCASEDELLGENNLKLASANNGPDSAKNYVRFINAIGGDYRLHSSSSCIDRGADSLMASATDINGSERIYGAAIDLGAIEYDGKQVEMVDYSQSVCYNTYTYEVVFDSTVSKFDWEIASKGNVEGYAEASGSGAAIPSMKLRTSKSEIDVLALKITPYDKDDVAGVPFSYSYYVYPDMDSLKMTFENPKERYVVNAESNDVTIKWNRLSLPIDVKHYDLYVWKDSVMPSAPSASLVGGTSHYLSNLQNHTAYKYMVAAVTDCDTVYSDVDTFRIDIPASLKVKGSVDCQLGSKLSETTSLIRRIKGFELSDSITYAISGKDADDFSARYEDGWDGLSGGDIRIFYTPTDKDKQSSEALLTLKSGKHTAEIPLNGVLANYYVFSAVAEKDVYKAGDAVAIKCSLSDAFGNPYAGKSLMVSIRKGGCVIKSLEAVTDASGEAETVYISSAYESGSYSVGVCLKGESSSAIYDEFDIPGISCSVGTGKWLVQKGDTVFGTITVSNRSSVDVHGLKVKALSLADGCHVSFDSIDVLKGLESQRLGYYVVGMSLTEGSEYLSSSFRVESEESVSAGFTALFFCEMPYGQIKVSPSNIQESVSKQNPKHVQLLLCNKGIGATGKVSIELPEGFEGLSIPSGTEIGSIEAGDTVKVALKMAYYEGAPINTPINGSIAVSCENGMSTSIAFSMEYTSSLTGDVAVDVVDEYYYNSSSKRHLAGATVEIRSTFNSKVIASAVTDSAGMARFDSIPEGEYLLAVTADKHSEYMESISVQPGKTLNKLAFVPYQAVTYTWNVKRTEIEDKYEVDLVTEFETNVPAPVVTAEFPYGVPARSEILPGEKAVAYLVLSNHGLIAALDVTIDPLVMGDYRLTPDIEHIDSLPANYSVLIPVSFERAGSGEKFDYDSSNGNCPPLRSSYFYLCGKRYGNSCFAKVWGDCFPDGQYIGSCGKGGRSSASFKLFDHTPRTCDECEDPEIGEMDIILASWSIASFFPVSGMLGGEVAGVYDPKAIWESLAHVDAVIYECFVADAEITMIRNGMDSRKVASKLYSGVISPLAGLVLPMGCYDLLSKVFSCIVNGKPANNYGEYMYDLIHKDDAKEENRQNRSTGTASGELRSADITLDFYENSTPYLLACHDLIEYVGFEVYRKAYIAECIGGGDDIMNTAGIEDYLKAFGDSIAFVKKIDIDEVKRMPVSDLSLSDMISISERWNNTVEAWNSGVFSPDDEHPNIASKEIIDKNIDGITNFFQYVLFRGFDRVRDMIDFIDKEKAARRSSVCASVTLQISQTMTMAREAFDGTLTVSNGQESLDMDSFKVVLEVRDENGGLANDLFQINTLSLDNIESVDGTASIAAGSEASAVFRFIPERLAALKAPANYSFGGRIVYLEAGDTISIKIAPVTMTVYPSPDLHIDYFMQRDILGDDALTHDRVEPSVPAVFGVRIDNQGYGPAKNVRLESAKPEIVDNEKGLLVNFDIIGSSMDGRDCSLGYENIDFGTIDAQSAKTGLWWLSSSLLGHFTKYEANVVHSNSFGNPDLSLVNGVDVHELIKTVEATGAKDDGIIDFLVADGYDDLPDAIYYSDGGRDTVYPAKKCETEKERLSDGDTVVRLTVTPSQGGWNYAQTFDPGNSRYEIRKVVRVKDGVEIPSSNIWTTFVTIPDGGDPLYEDRLHFLDYITTLGENDYDIYYSIRRDILKVTEISGTPAGEALTTTPVDSVVVKFSSEIQEESFDYRDIVLLCQTDTVSDSTITVKRIGDLTYSVDISSKTKAFGFYTLEINADNIYDDKGYPGEFGMKKSWVQCVTDTITPAVPDTLAPADPDDVDDNHGSDDQNGDKPDHGADFTTEIAGIENDDIVIFVSQNCIYVKSSSEGYVDIYDILSRLVVQNAHYREGVTNVAVLPKGTYIIKGKKVIVM